MPTETRQRKFYPGRSQRLSHYIKNLSGVVAYYPMNETSGIVATDTKSGRNGNIVNLNLIPNGNMESDYGWSNYNAPTSNARSSAVVRSGSYSRYINVDASNKGAMGINYLAIDGHTYRVSGYGYAAVGSTGKARLRRNQGRVNYIATGTKIGEWELLTADATASSGGLETVRLESSGAGEFYFDDVSVVDLADLDNTITGANGAIGKAYQFDGVNDYVEIQNDAVFSPATTGKFTFSAIITPDVLDFTDSQAMGGDEGGSVHIIGKYESSAAEYYLRMYNKTGSSRPNRISFYVFESAGGEGIGGYFEDTLVAGEPMLITGTVDGQYVSIYKNGVLRQSTDYTIDQGYAGPLTLSATASPVRIGTVALNVSDFGWFQGKIQHLMFLNRDMKAHEVERMAQLTGLVA